MSRNRMSTVWWVIASLCALTPNTLNSQDSQLSLPDSVSVKRVKCPTKGCEWLAGFLFGPAASKKTADLPVANWGPSGLEITHVHLIATGDVSEKVLEVKGGSGDLGSLASMGPKILTLALPSLTHERADRFTGEIRVRVAEMEESLAVPFTLYLRNGAWWVIMHLLVGLLVGRLLVRINQTGSSESPTEKGWIKVAGFTWGKGDVDRTQKIASTITGVAWTEEDAEQKHYRIRVGAGLILLAVAVYEGLKLLYFNDLTFGDNGFLDYAAVFAWGFGADAGQRFITNLRWFPNKAG